MTVYGTPGSSPLNTSPFQGTAPGNPVGAAIQQTLPGVGMFPPNANSLSGDTAMAAMSRGAIPANTNVSGFGVPGPGNKPILAMEGQGERGTGPGFVANGGSLNIGPGAGGNNAGGLTQANGATGESSTIPANVPSSIPVLGATPSYRG